MLQLLLLAALLTPAYNFSPSILTPCSTLSPKNAQTCFRNGGARLCRLYMASGEDAEDEEIELVEEKKEESPKKGLDLIKAVLNPFKTTFNAGANLRQNIEQAVDQITGSTAPTKWSGVSASDIEKYERMLYSQFDSPEEVPTVLVVGATGETGRIVVRKLVLRGFNVRVLVRDLFSKTLDLLGSGVTYAQGDMTKPRSIIDALSGVDKVIYCAQSRDESPEARRDEYIGFKNVVTVFQDRRVYDYGTEYSTKRMLFNFERERDRNLWQLADAYRFTEWNRNEFGHASFISTAKQSSFSYVTLESIPIKLNLGPFSGLILRAIGDGKMYRFVLRTDLYDSMGVQFEAEVATESGKWMTHRMPFSSFEPFKDGNQIPREAGISLDKRKIRQVAVAYYPRPGDQKLFTLSLDYIKVYRTQLEPEFVFVSSAEAPPMGTHNRTMEAYKEKSPKGYYAAMGEAALRNSGLTYTIVRVKSYNNAPGGLRAYSAVQDVDVDQLTDMSRADVADICVKCLLDPRACNLAFYVTQSRFAPSIVSPTVDSSALFARLRPNT